MVCEIESDLSEVAENVRFSDLVRVRIRVRVAVEPTVSLSERVALPVMEFETISVWEVVTESENDVVSVSVSVASGVEERLFVLETDIVCVRVAVCDAVSVRECDNVCVRVTDKVSVILRDNVLVRLLVRVIEDVRVCDSVSVMVRLKDCVRDGVGEIVSEWDSVRLID